MSAFTQPLDSSTLAGEATDPAQELYAHAAELSAAAHALEAATHDEGAVTALAPTLACLEASQLALAHAVSRLRAQALTRLADADELRQRRANVAVDLERLAGVLEQAEVAAARARDSIDRVAVELAFG